ncbi:hypothetical protein [Bacillus cereus]|uniref:CYTH domain-containing protein n=1 Tax=Bacillus cereus (strain VD014) TaxID=1053223 RepID=A0A9W5K1Q4_BACC8|nr:hypothetical protein [Bacillus cereus]EJR11755.1 hypothetical protein IIA_05862 [Bacillus cereus VD014]
MLIDHEYQYEVKFFLKIDKVLDKANNLKDCIAKEFNISNNDFKQLDIQFIDTIEQGIYKEGWILRNRKKKNKENYELTYKKRYPIANGNIDDILNQVKSDGFHDSSDNFTVEVDWGLHKQTLNISCEKKEPIPDSSSSNLPDIKELRTMFLDNAPEIFLNWQVEKWGENQIQNSKVYGPVKAKKYEGIWESTNVNIELWTLEGYSESIIEISLEKSKDKNKSLQEHDKLKEFLCEKGWLSEEDISKTQWVIEHSN